MHYKKLGILLRAPTPDSTEARLVPPLSPAEACDLYAAFAADLFARLSKLKKISTTVFHVGEAPGAVESSIPHGCSLAPQDADRLGDRFENAFRRLLDVEGRSACVMGSECPDLPLVYLKRAYVKLKHRDVVLGPTFGGGYYLIGLKRPVPGLFEKMSWGKATLLGETLRRVESAGLTCTLLPPWYEVNTPESLLLLETMLLARRIEKKDRLFAVERVFESIRGRQR